MENLLGLLKVKVVRGVHLAVRDLTTSDPYVVVRMGDQKVKTLVQQNTLNPEWDETLTLKVAEPVMLLRLEVFDKDRFSKDDAMGNAEFNIHPFLQVVQSYANDVPKSAEVLKKVEPTNINCLTEESCIRYVDGKFIQDLHLRLKDVECGELQVQLEWRSVRKQSSSVSGK